jgi:hypothetical protein
MWTTRCLRRRLATARGKPYGCLNFSHPYILYIASYMGVWISDTLIFYCELYGCLKFRHSYILLRVIWVSEFQILLYFIASYYMAVWNSDTHITRAQYNIYRILDGCEEIWILCSSGKNNISRVSAANEWDIVFDTRT